jgi:hypothetical protein
MLAKMAGELHKPNAQTTILPVRREGGREGGKTDKCSFSDTSSY